MKGQRLAKIYFIETSEHGVYVASHTIWLAPKVATGSELSVAWPVGDRFRMLSEGPNRASSILAAIFQGQCYFFDPPSNPTSG